MHRIEFSRAAKKYLSRLPKDRARQITNALKDLATTEHPTFHRNAKQMKGDFKSLYHLRIGDYRAIFALKPDPEIPNQTTLQLISVTAIGSRGDIYK